MKHGCNVERKCNPERERERPILQQAIKRHSRDSQATFKRRPILRDKDVAIEDS